LDLRSSRVIPDPWREILSVAILAAGLFVAPSPAQTLSGPHDLEWTDRRVKINRLEFTDSVTRFDEKKKADADSIFVYMDLTVTNISHKGNTFVPQNTLKIIVGDNAFDAEDLDGSGVKLRQQY
jgi:hypothetical protein